MPDTASPVVGQGLAFVCAGYGVVTCYDVSTGELVWQQEFESSFVSSPVMAGGLVYLCDTEGTTHVFQASRKFKAVATNALAEPIYATPALTQGRVWIRTAKHVYCIGNQE